MAFQLSDLKKYQTAYLILFFYFVISVVTATVGHHYDSREGFTNGYIVGIIISLLLWYSVGQKMAKL